MSYWVKSAADRRTIRRAVELPCQVVAEAGFRLLGEQTLDVSVEGILLRSDAPVRIGEAVFVALRAPRGDHWIDAEAVVARVVRGLRARDRGPAIGLRFTQVDPVDAAILAGGLRGLPPPLPRRHRRKDYAGSVVHIVESVSDDELVVLAA